MKTTTLLTLGLLLALPVALTAQPGSDYEPLKLIKKSDIVFPAGASELGISEGEVHMLVSVDATGKLADYLVTSYTHSLFADRAVLAIKRWAFEPARIHGEPCSAVSELSFSFKSRGIVVVDMTLSSYVALRNYQLAPGAYSYRARSLRELDRIPTPSKIVTPNYPANLAGQGPTSIEVNFYIDEEGHVRLPSVAPQKTERDEMLASAAVGAVAQWQFEPPTSHGHPVLVLARQEFKFQPVAATAAATAPAK